MLRGNSLFPEETREFCSEFASEFEEIFGRGIARSHSEPMFHPLNHLPIGVEKGKGVSSGSARHVGPPSSLAECAWRIIMRAQLRDITYTFFKTTAVHLRCACRDVRTLACSRSCAPRRGPEAPR